MYDVFVSYSTLDRPVVEGVVRTLRRARLEVWFDTRELEPGSDTYESIPQAITTSRSFLLCIGPHGLGPFQKRELNMVRTHVNRAEGKDLRIVSLLLPRATPRAVPLDLGTLVYLELCEDLSLRNLVRALRREERPRYQVRLKALGSAKPRTMVLFLAKFTKRSALEFEDIESRLPWVIPILLGLPSAEELCRTLVRHGAEAEVCEIVRDSRS